MPGYHSIKHKKKHTPKLGGKYSFCKFRAFWAAEQCKADKEFLQHEVQFLNFQKSKIQLVQLMKAYLDSPMYTFIKFWDLNNPLLWKLNLSVSHFTCAADPIGPVNTGRALLKTGIARPSNSTQS